MQATIRYLAIVSDDPERLARFYTSGFGMRELGRSSAGDGLGECLRFPGARRKPARGYPVGKGARCLLQRAWVQAFGA